MRSMTGFGQASVPSRLGRLDVEVKSVNARYLELSTRLPNGWGALEERVKKIVQRHVPRGRVHVSVLPERDEAGPVSKVHVDLALARRYHRSLALLAHRLKLRDGVRLDQILALPNVVQVERQKMNYSALGQSLARGLDQALRQMIRMQEAEGRRLSVDLRQRLAEIESNLKALGSDLEASLAIYRDKLKSRLAQLSSDTSVDEERIAREVALYADRCDISEELTRLSSHLSQFRSLLKQKRPVGRQIDFLLQELQREANTLGAKAPSVGMSQRALAIKSILEKIREQVQNIA